MNKRYVQTFNVLFVVLFLIGCASPGSENNLAITITAPDSTPLHIDLSSTPTRTPVPATETATATLPAVVDGIRLLTPNSFIPDEPARLVSIKGYEIGDNPENAALKKGLTYAYLNIDPVHTHDWVISTISIYYPGAGAAAMERAKNEPANEFSTCDRKAFKQCELTMEQLLNGSYERWAQKTLGDTNHLIKVVSFPGATSFEKFGNLQSSLAAWETDQLLTLDTDVYLGRETKYKDALIERSLEVNSQMFEDLNKFIKTGNPTSIDGDTKIYSGVLPIK